MVELYPSMETLHLFVLDGSGKNCRDAKAKKGSGSRRKNSDFHKEHMDVL